MKLKFSFIALQVDVPWLKLMDPSIEKELGLSDQVLWHYSAILLATLLWRGGIVYIEEPWCPKSGQMIKSSF